MVALLLSGVKTVHAMRAKSHANSVKFEFLENCDVVSCRVVFSRQRRATFFVFVPILGALSLSQCENTDQHRSRFTLVRTDKSPQYL